MKLPPEIEVVKQATQETQQIIRTLFKFTRTHQSALKDLTKKVSSKRHGEFEDARYRLKRQIQRGKNLTRIVESILKPQELILSEGRPTDDTGVAVEVRSLLELVSDQNQSIRILETMLLNIELRVDEMGPKFAKGRIVSAS